MGTTVGISGDQPRRGSMGFFPRWPQLFAGTILAAAAFSTCAAEPAGEPTLQAFGSCASFTTYMRDHARQTLGPWGLSGSAGFAYRSVGVPVAGGDMAAGSVASTPAFSGTNVQEDGVDEPDMVKTDGRTVFALVQGRLHAIDVRGPKPRLSGSLDVGGGWGQQLILHRGRLVVLASGWGGAKVAPDALPGRLGIAPWRGEPRTTLTEIDVSNPSAMRVREVSTVAGQYLSARRVDATLRVVIRGEVRGPELQYPTGTSGWERARAVWYNRWALDNSRSSDWIPTYTRHSLRSGRSTVRPLSRCTETYAPTEFAGLGTITVLKFELGRGLAPVDTDAILSDGDTVYASAHSLYVATRAWQDPAETADPAAPPSSWVNTQVHRFDTSLPGQTRYVSSGDVDGYLLGQWSMSEHAGDLRVVSTDEPPWWGSAGGQSQTRVTVLREQEGRLAAVGAVDGLGLGERVYAVRFIGPLGYVVTFRQVDPLYVIDASEPTAPRVRGELKIPGYSAYLHPVGEGLLLGIGRSATPEGRVLGVQASLFDVSNPDQPLALQQLDLGNGWTESEFNHHAFLYWPATRQALVPVESWVADLSMGRYVYEAAAVGIKVGSSDLQENGRVRHEIPVDDAEQPVRQEAVRRTFVVGETLYSLSDSGLKASSLDTLEVRGWLGFAPSPAGP